MARMYVGVLVKKKKLHHRTGREILAAAADDASLPRDYNFSTPRDKFISEIFNKYIRDATHAR